MDKTVENLVEIPVDSVVLEGMLGIPDNSQGIVIFAHGSGSSRLSPRNNFVAKILRSNGFSTLLLDLLTEREDIIYKTRFDINLLTDRLIAATRWIQKHSQTKNLTIGYFGASTGAAAALSAAANLGNEINAIVSRGGRPDLAENYLDKVKAPTLLIIGGNDDVVIELNKFAYDKLNTIKELIIIPGATHLFEESGKLEEVARFAAAWFIKYLTKV